MDNSELTQLQKAVESKSKEDFVRRVRRYDDGLPFLSSGGRQALPTSAEAKLPEVEVITFAPDTSSTAAVSRLLWSSARVAGVPVLQALRDSGQSGEELRSSVEREVC